MPDNLDDKDQNQCCMFEYICSDSKYESILRSEEQFSITHAVNVELHMPAK